VQEECLATPADKGVDLIPLDFVDSNVMSRIYDKLTQVHACPEPIYVFLLAVMLQRHGYKIPK
jgi:hypothetical protein